MANLYVPKEEKEWKSMGVSALKQEHAKVVEAYNQILDGKYYYCHNCNTFHPAANFYSDKRFASGLYPECIKSLLLQATDYDPKENVYYDNKAKTINVFRKLDLPFVDSAYKQACNTAQASVGEKNRGTGYQHLLTWVKTLQQYRGKTFANSEILDDGTGFESTRTARKEIKKVFGPGFSESDYVFLQDQYDDWRARTEVSSKSSETYVMQICLQLLDIDKDRKAGKDVSNKLKTLDTLMNAANLQPKQNVSNSSTDSLTFGQLIEKWETEKPIPEPEPEFKDVDGIGKYIRVWFSGWLAKAMGLKNAYSEETEEYLKQYTVTKDATQNEAASDEIYDTLFGQTDQ